MKRIAALAFVLICAAAIAQDDFVTSAEMSKALGRVQVALTKSSGVTFKPVPEGTAKAATRKEIIKVLNDMFEAARPKFVITPRPYRTDDAPVVKANDAETAKTIKKLARYGAMAPVGPLAIGPKDGLTPEQFGDAVGMVVVQIAALTHTPSPKWTVALSGGY